MRLDDEVRGLLDWQVRGTTVVTISLAILRSTMYKYICGNEFVHSLIDET